MNKPYIVGWFSYSDVENVFPKLRELPVIGDCPIYKEAPYDEIHRDLIIKNLIDNDYVIYGDTHQSNEHNCVPVFNDGYITVSMRTWGGIMADAMNIKNHTREYDYMDFYMCGGIPERRPGEDV